MKFDIDKVKEFGIEHGEKFGLAIAVVLLGMFIVKAASRESLPENLQPEKINRDSATAEENMKKLAVPPKGQDVVAVNFVSQIEKEATVVPAKIAVLPIRQEAFPDPVKRVDPTLFPIEELRAVSFRGGIAEVAQVGAGNGPMQPAIQPAGPAAVVPGKAAPARLGGLFRGAQARQAAAPPAQGLAGGVAGAQGPKPLPSGFPPFGPPLSGFAEGRDGIVITGLIPLQQQREEYAQRFKNARRGAMAEGTNGGERGPHQATVDTDSPNYVWCFLERTDTTDGSLTLLNFGDLGQVGRDWQQPENKELIRKLGMNGTVLKKIVAQMALWAGVEQEVVDPTFVAEAYFTWALPPVLLRVWGAEAAHPPQVPLAVTAAATGPADTAAPAGAPAGGDFDAPVAGPAVGRGGAPRGLRRREAPPMAMGPRAQAQTQAQAIDVPYKLFRFVDLDVEPGHAYQYRVRMLLRNPNFGLEAQVLAKPETASVVYRPTPWSEKSAAAFVPRHTRVLAGSIDRPKKAEPQAKIGVFIFDPVQAIELIKDFTTDLGALVGTTVADQTIKDVADPVKRQVADITGNFRTASVLLDFRGNDEKLPGAGNLTEPAEMLFLDDVDHPENPQLIVVSEAKDKPIFDRWKLTHVPPPAALAANGLNPEPEKKPAGPTKTNGGLLPQTTPKYNGTTRRPPTGH
jgi:hypothetical protein